MIFRWVATLLLLALFPYRGIVQGAVLANRSVLKARFVLAVSLSNLLLLGLVVAEALFGFLLGHEFFPSPWVAITFVVAFIGGLIAGWNKGTAEDQSHVAAGRPLRFEAVEESEQKPRIRRPFLVILGLIGLPVAGSLIVAILTEGGPVIWKIIGSISVLFMVGMLVEGFRGRLGRWFGP